jgi:hypothetical protein
MRRSEGTMDKVKQGFHLSRREFLLSAGAVGLSIKPIAFLTTLDGSDVRAGHTRYAVLQSMEIWTYVPGKEDGATKDRSLLEGDVVWIADEMPDDPMPGELAGWVDVMKKPKRRPGFAPYDDGPHTMAPIITTDPPDWWLAHYGDNWV